MEQLRQRPILYQETAARQIASAFGAEFTYKNKNGNRAISKAVLTQFRKISGDDIIWERGQRMWRRRESTTARGGSRGNLSRSTGRITI